MKRLIAFLAVFAMLAGCGGGGDNLEETPDLQPDMNENADNNGQPYDEVSQENIFLTLTAVGDNLIHNTLSFDSRIETGYDFSHIYSRIQPLISQSDIAIVNQEVPLDGTVGSYPTLSAPTEVAYALAWCGFDVASLANNHMSDKGASGVVSTINALQNAGLTVVGASDGSCESWTVIEREGVKTGFLSYTYGLNSGLGSSEVSVNTIDMDSIKIDIEKIRPMCDFLAVAMHWGTEYSQTPSDSQREYASFLAQWGADLIIGHHPHVLQPAEWIDNGRGGETLCIYSLGNFVSGQREQDRMLGGILTLKLEFAPDHSFIGFSDADIEGAVTHFTYGDKQFEIYPLSEYTEELAAVHGLHKYGLPFSCGYLTERMEGIKESLLR